jgi:hypothetical protein
LQPKIRQGREIFEGKAENLHDWLNRNDLPVFTRLRLWVNTGKAVP